MRIDYKSKVHSVVSVCERGKGIDQLNNLRGVTVDNTTRTGMIYVADNGNNCVKVFDNTLAKRCVFRRFLKTSSDGELRTLSGSRFHSVGTAI